MIDTHTHLYFAESYPDGGSEAVERALEAGVSHMVLPNVSFGSMEPLLALHHLYPDVTSVAPGLHPEDVDGDWRLKADDIFARFEGENPAAVGEIGVDLYHDKDRRFAQMDAFGYQLEKAADMKLPVIIHSREALDDTLHVLGLMDRPLPSLIFHSFTSGPDDIRRILELPDTYVGINGVVTFKNAPLVREAVAEAGIERLLLETDAPYLAPVPMRGRTNESSYLCHIRDKIAEVTGRDPAEVERITDLNARRIFRLG